MKRHLAIRIAIDNGFYGNEYKVIGVYKTRDEAADAAKEDERSMYLTGEWAGYEFRVFKIEVPE